MEYEALVVRPDLKLMSREEIQRRLTRMKGERNVSRPEEVTRYDVARWFGIDARLVRMHNTGKEPINDFWQVNYTQLFALIDAGLIEIRWDGRKKTLVRLAKPKAPVKKTVRPFINFQKMTLEFDR